MTSLPAPQQYYNDPAVYYASNQEWAIIPAIMLHIGYIPIYFLAFCVYKNPQLVMRYKTTIVFAGVMQFAISLPHTIFKTWLAIFVYREIETTVFMCTLVRMVTAVFNFVSFNALTAISISRLLLIVFDIKCGLAWNLVFFGVSTLPILADTVYMFFVSRPTRNSICGPLLFYYEIAPMLVWNGYIFAIPLIAVCLNLVTAGYLLYQRHFAKSSLSSSRRAVNELYVALVLLTQSVIPAFTMSTKGFRSIQEIYGIKSGNWFMEVIETSTHATTGLNMFISMVAIKHFRMMFKQCVRRDNSVTSVDTVKSSGSS